MEDADKEDEVEEDDERKYSRCGDHHNLWLETRKEVEANLYRQLKDSSKQLKLDLIMWRSSSFYGDRVVFCITFVSFPVKNTVGVLKI
ncbi:hypothetical protein L2E82_13987 [Cichorium intybus]|uniref:Uncharacterized protein n=1 Tax=Cichorium intybus TaxID=13427 RepID=A0ACB9EY65_CICIN|nr:hypothetical protein L2E82_13987 [Cichorium intybus]